MNLQQLDELRQRVEAAHLQTLRYQRQCRQEPPPNDTNQVRMIPAGAARVRLDVHRQSAASAGGTGSGT
jgi:hypothetical protein